MQKFYLSFLYIHISERENMKIQNIQKQNFTATINYYGPHTKKSIEKEAIKEIQEIKNKQERLNVAMDAFNDKEIKAKLKRLPEEDLVEFSSLDADDKLDAPYLVYTSNNEHSRNIMRYSGEVQSPYLDLSRSRDIKKSINNWLDKLLAKFEQ